VLEVLFSLDRQSDVVMTLRPNQALQAVFPSKSLDPARAMFSGATGKIARHSNVKGAVAPIGYDVDPAALHPASFGRFPMRCNRPRDGRVKPGHDDALTLSAASGAACSGIR